MNFKIYKFKKIYIILLTLIIYLLFNFLLLKGNRGKRVGIVGFMPDRNIGNNLLKYSMYIFLKNIGYYPTLITVKSGINIFFLRHKLKILEINNYYTDLNEKDFDILIVNSDQCWAYNFKQIFEIGFLSFAKNWNIIKFVYAASIAHKIWNVTNKFINSAKDLIKQFSDISVRESSSIEIIHRNFGRKPSLVLDPTFLLSKHDYLKLLDNYSSYINPNENYLGVYILDNSKLIKNFIRNASKKLKYRIMYISAEVNNYIENFIFSFNICKAIITDSFHGSIFSIIFDKPFIAFVNAKRGSERFSSLNQTFKLFDRFIFPRKFKKNDLDILKQIPDYNRTNFNLLKMQSIQFIKQNLRIK